MTDYVVASHGYSSLVHILTAAALLLLALDVAWLRILADDRRGLQAPRSPGEGVAKAAWRRLRVARCVHIWRRDEVSEGWRCVFCPARIRDQPGSG